MTFPSKNYISILKCSWVLGQPHNILKSDSWFLVLAVGNITLYININGIVDKKVKQIMSSFVMQ